MHSRTRGHHRRSARAALVRVLVLIAPLGLGAAPVAPQCAVAQPGRLIVTGYQEDASPVRAIARNADSISTVAVDGVNERPSGRALDGPRSADLRQLRAAHGHHLRATLVFGNWSDAIGDFSEPLAHRMLSHPAAVRDVAGALAGDVRRQHWDGVSVDLEMLVGRDTLGLVRFVRTLRHDLPHGKIVSVNLSNYTNARGFRQDGYDLAALGRAATEIVLMGYDQHGPWSSRPGPVGALAWQRAGLNVLLRYVPRRKITLGVAGYGYVWGPHRNYAVSDAGARRLVARDHATAHFDTTAGEWRATLANGSRMWWSDARSYKLRVNLANRMHLHGLAVWALGESDRLPPAGA